MQAVQRAVPVHYLRPNEAVRSPKRVAFFDTETVWSPGGDGDHHRLRCWVLSGVRRDLAPTSKRARSHAEGETADSLVDAIEALAGAKTALWVYSHNLSFDLAVTALPVRLVRRGWELYRHAIHSDAPWASLRRGGQHIHICDSFSWMSTSLAKIGATLQREKLELPENADTLDDWYARCRGDVEILELAMLSLMEEWDRREAGVWGVTGTGSGFSHMRHVGDKKHVVIRPEAEALGWEREALSGGRREIWYQGELPARPLVNIDARHAFATVCAELLLPIDRWKGREGYELDYYDLGREERQLMADCLVETETPRYPARIGRSWFFPIGRFWSRLPGPELEEARRRGELLAIGKGYKYVMGRFMQPFGREIVEELKKDRTEQATPWTLACKGWSRSVPGRWALRTSRVEQETVGYGEEWQLEQAVYGPNFAPAAILTIPPVRQVIVRDADAENAFPAVLAFIQSHVRVRLNRLVDALQGAVLQANTDGVIVDPSRGPESLREAAGAAGDDLEAVGSAVAAWLGARQQAWAPLQMQVRKTFRGGHIWTPAHAILGDEQKVAGVPARAEMVGRARWRFQTWAKLPSQIKGGHPGEFVVGQREVSLADAVTNRWICADGTCLPVQLTPAFGPSERDILFPPWDEVEMHGGLSPRQHPLLERVLRDRQ